MRPASDHLTRLARRALSAVATMTLVLAANGCSHNDAPQVNNDAGSSGSGGSGSGGSNGSGSGGSSVTGSGGSSAGTGGDSSGGTGGDNGAGSGGASGTGGTTGGTGGFAIGPEVPLPVVVTSVYDNQGWFGDVQEMMAFTPGSTIINQAESATGPCAQRVANARGKCLKVVFTPPTNITPLTSQAYIGVFLLTTVKANHPDAQPPETIGQANWGSAEPGIHIAAGATKIAFQVAGDTAGQMVAFKAGAGPDVFGIPQMVMTTTTSWQAGSLSLNGQDYGNNVVGGFAWVLTDTTKPATFYIDDIVWTM